ncbi:phage minor capsid protein [Roseburia inulinivorans]|uniref:phage minor capsid protein n=1 Tax=Roseburia inulinivorans TaxID=360807 RepID=UPI0032C0BB5D
MLRPDYFYGKTDKLVEMYQDLENWIISDIATRLIKSGELSGTADRELWKLQQMGLHNTEIVKRISEMSGKSRNEVRRLLRDSVMTSFSDDKEVLTQISASDIISPLKNNMAILAMNAELIKTSGELDNLTKTTINQTQKDLLNMLNEVDYRVASGMQSYSSAVCEILDRYAESGVMVEYPTGTKRSLEAAVRCCIVTSMNQTAAQVTNVYIAQNKIEYVLVSAHPGARYDKKDPTGISSHDHWQGKAYKIIGSEPGFPNLLESTGYTIDPKTGTGTVVNLLGLHGYNCRHSHGPWRKDMVNKYLDENGNVNINADESQKLYDLQQKQILLEREIRKTKREIMTKKQELDMIAETDVKEILQPQYDKLAYKLRMQNKKLQSFCKNNDLQLQGDRTKVSGFNRKQSAVANGRATAYKNKIEKNGTTKME